MRYDTDLTEEEWAIVGPMLPPAKPGGRPRKTDVRRVLEGIFYVIRTGCQWRNLPHDFPKWDTVYWYFKVWREAGLIMKISQKLVKLVRRKEHGYKRRYPTLAILDSSSVKTGKLASIESRGFDGGKRVKGRKRHIAVDGNGLLLAVSVTPANIHDIDGAQRTVRRMKMWMKERAPKMIYGDGGYSGARLRDFVKNTIGAVIRVSTEVVRERARNSAGKGFAVMKNRWQVERTYAWLSDYRRLDKDHERNPVNSAAMVYLSMIRLMLRRLTGQAVVWGKP